MKLSEIKKELGGKGVIIEVEDISGGLTAYRHSDIHYDDYCLYCTEKFVNLSETDSDIVKLICEKYGVDRVFTYKEYENSDDYYLLLVKKSVSDAIPKYEGDFIL